MSSRLCFPSFFILSLIPFPFPFFFPTTTTADSCLPKRLKLAHALGADPHFHRTLQKTRVLAPFFLQPTHRAHPCIQQRLYQLIHLLNRTFMGDQRRWVVQGAQGRVSGVGGVERRPLGEDFAFEEKARKPPCFLVLLRVLLLLLALGVRGRGGGGGGTK